MNSQYIVSGLTRHVKPYIYEFKTYAKGRWVGKNIVEILTKEFGGFDSSYWKAAIEDTNVLVNGKPTTESYIVRNSDLLLHRTHRHEPPIVGEITLVGETNDLIAVCKPASMPMHPCGGYKYNTLLTILKEEPLIPNQPQLHSVHRLDRVTSGLVILAKSSEVANNISKEIRSNQTEKVYLARVKGRFPASLQHLQHLSTEQLFQPTESEEVQKELRKDGLSDCSLSKKRARRNQETSEEIPEPSLKLQCTDSSQSIETPSSSTTQSTPPPQQSDPRDCIGYGYSSNELLIRYPIDVVSHREGVHCCSLTGKQSLSGFKFLGYRQADDTSLIECYPYTGRTHQLRLHLQLIGNPIANDPCYGGTLFYGQNERIEIAKQVAIKLLQVKEMTGGRLVSNLPHLSDLINSTSSSSTTTTSTTSTTSTEVKLNPKRQENETEEEYLIRNCRYCRQSELSGVTNEEQSIVHCDSIWLHAVRYRGSNWMFETQPPTWANRDEFVINE